VTNLPRAMPGGFASHSEKPNRSGDIAGAVSNSHNSRSHPTTSSRAAGRTSTGVWRFDEYLLDAARYELWRAGVAVALEPQVFELLSYLVENHHRMVTRDELMDAIWGAGHGSEASLSTRIKAARRALGDDGVAQNYIRTVRARGYQFVGVPTTVLLPAENLPPKPLPTQRVAFSYARDGVRLAYGITGTGPPLVRAANWMTHLGYDVDSPVWRHWVSEMAANHTLIRYDERGCGLSEWDVGDFTFDDWLSDLESVVDTLELKRFPLLGVSQGGAVAAAYAARHPERVSKLVLVSAYAQGRAVRAVSDTEHRLAELDLELARLGWGRKDPAFRQVFAAQFQPGGTREDWDAFDQMQRLTTSPQNAVRFLEQFASIDVRDEVRDITCPTLIVHSRDDLRVPYGCAHQLAALIPGARLVALDSANHLLTAGEPAWQIFCGEVEQFLRD
jgi:pimeloyl-ACP methyl ester carboxylesterase/DNA-binding winged helix-turn-helix (wHTH) protein